MNVHVYEYIVLVKLKQRNFGKHDVQYAKVDSHSVNTFMSIYL